ncbi:MAG TPA: hypothetical protein PKN30_13350, partial [Flavobacteriales bacterium]|nr:hypothetical protein [Flavobacteriales bacterium]
KQKGRITPGCDADLVIWDPEARVVVKEEHIQHRHKLSPYSGRSLYGAVDQSMLLGCIAFQSGAFARPEARTLRA